MKNHEQKLISEDEKIKENIVEDLAHLYNYPSIGKLFSDTSSLQQIRNKLNTTKQRLDQIIRRGSNEESQKATKALTAISLTLQFLQDLEDERHKKTLK